ncbi:ABC transporter substrate-binding protein [Cohnella sp. GCM10027633]|uniref:ABC transporter substrate-binding protein n=1 Tax=unclassified Cohnella TaxID=2636738 RepID=UPI003637DF5D
MRTTGVLSLALALSLLAGAAMGCSNDNDGAGPSSGTKTGGREPVGKLTVLTNRTDLVDDGTMDKYAAEFKLRYPGAEVAFEALTNYATDAQIRLTTGEAGDVLLIPGNIPNSELPNYFEPLPDAMFDDMYFGDQMAYKGKRYGLATGVSTQGIIYNKRAFAEAGVGRVPRTLDELYAAAGKLKAAGITPIYMNFGAQWPMKSWGEDSVWFTSGNADYLSEMVGQDAPWQPGNEWGRMIGIARTLVGRGYVERDLATNNWESSKSDVASGKAAMYYLGNWVIPQLVDAGAKPEDIGFFPMPYDNSGKLNAPLGPD